MGLSYADAVRLMGGQQSRTIAALDRLAGGLLLVASAAGSGFALSLFEAKGELARLSAELVQGLGERLRGLDRFARTERLAAAHSVVALTAFFEVLARSHRPAGWAAPLTVVSWPVSMRAVRRGGLGVFAAVAVVLSAQSAVLASSAPAPTWTKQAPAASPPGRWLPSMAYDAATGTVVLFGGRGGCGCTGVYFGGTWAWGRSG